MLKTSPLSRSTFGRFLRSLQKRPKVERLKGDGFTVLGRESETFSVSTAILFPSNVRLVPNLCLCARDLLLQTANTQQEVALLERPSAVGTHEGHALGRQTEGDGARLARLQFHLREIAQPTVVRCQRCHEVAGVEQHRFLSNA